MEYSANDAVLYVFSLLVTLAMMLLAFDEMWQRCICVLGLVYLAVMFVVRHGASLDLGSFRVIARGIAGYPRRLARLIGVQAGQYAIALGIFIVALAAELLLKQFAGETFWTAPVPYMWIFGAHFTALTVYRTVILWAHWRKASHVNDVLCQTIWRRELARVGVRHHIFLAYVTGVTSHVCLWLPALVFWNLTAPTVVREVVLWLGYIALRSLPTRAAARARSLDLARGVTYSAHELDHRSRFYFTVFHGHHHDVIPSGLIGAAGTGFVEAIDRGIHWAVCPFFAGSLATFLFFSRTVYGDIITHQYIPGVFPYSSRFVMMGLHHVAHHYGSLRPLGVNDPRDLEHGYKVDNGKVTSFLTAAMVHEGISPATAENFTDKRRFFPVRSRILPPGALLDP